MDIGAEAWAAFFFLFSLRRYHRLAGQIGSCALFAELDELKVV